METAAVFDRLGFFTAVFTASVQCCGFTSSTAGEKSAPACGLQGAYQIPQSGNKTLGVGGV